MRKSAWLLSAGLLALAAPAFAQTPPDTDTDQGAAQPTEGSTAEGAAVDNQAVEQQPSDTSEIIVTATRRNEALSDVPLAVSAVTAETLRNSGASDIRQLIQVAPSLMVFSTTSEGGAARANIRGIGTVGDNPGLEGSVAVYIDGVYRSRTGVALTELGPLDRIEVLRGPQGTLFGRNASAGVISVMTAKPQFRTFLSGAVSIGNYDMRRLEATANTPLSDTVSARIDGVYMKRDGFLKEVVSGRRVNDRDRWLLRGQLLFQPSDNLSVRLIADYTKRNEECCAGVYLPTHDYVAGIGETTSTIATIIRGLGGIILDDPFDRKIALTPGRSFRSDVRDSGVSGEIIYDLGGAELTSITAYRANKYVGGQDLDFNSLDIAVRPDDGGFGNKFKVFTQEARLQGTALGERLDWLVGGYFADEKLTRRDDIGFGADADIYFRQVVRANPLLAAFPGYNLLNPFVQGVVATQLATNPAFAAIPVASRPTVINAIAGQVVNTPLANLSTRDVFRQKGTNYAFFTHNIFKVTDQLSVTLGARYTIDKKKLSADLTGAGQCAAFQGNIARLRALAAAGTANPALYGSLTPAVVQLANALAAATPAGTTPTLLPGLAAAPCGLITPVTGDYSGGSKSEKRWSGTAVLSYKPMDRLLTYASYSRGYKAGGFNLDRAGLTFGDVNLNDLRFKPELVDAYELGAKWNGRGIDVNVALFTEDFRNFQLNTFNGVNFVVENINSCSDSLGGADEDITANGPTSANPVQCGGKKKAGVRSRGIEVEAFFRPIADVNGSLGVTYAHTRYRKNLIGAGGYALVPALFQLPGSRVSNAPDFTVTGSLGWTPRLGSSGLRGLFYIDGRHQSKFNTGSDLDREKLDNGYTVFNGRVGVGGPENGWSVELWAQNLLNAKYKQVAFDAPLQGSGTREGVDRGFYTRATQLYGAFLAEPRVFGITLRGNFRPK
jgi:iron complex outermembrane receptor protein